MIVDHALEPALRPSPPNELIRPSIDEVDEQRAGVVDERPAAPRLAAWLARTECRRVEALLNASVIVHDEVELAFAGFLEPLLTQWPSTARWTRSMKNVLLAALTRNAGVPEGTIGVEISDGVVTLTGEVPSWRAREAAERAVARGAGVGQVDNRITVGDEGLTKVRVPVVPPR